MLAELGGSPADDFAAAVSRAPCPLVSHGTEADPIFRYANDAALSLWETDWDTFTSMPSRLSAAPVTDIQDDRSKLLKEALAKGWVDNYSGVRVSRGGKSFMIKDTALWNVVDEAGVRHGQAALIKSWSPV